MTSAVNDFYLATANTRFSKNWKNAKWSWPDFVKKCSATDFTKESAEEYIKYSKDQQDGIKDVGGFVGGYLTDGVRKTANVKFRSLITLDMDFGTPGIWDQITAKFNGAIIAYSTHKHTPEQPRLRIIVPLSRPVKPEEYEPIARKFADKFGMNLFDDSTYQTARLFYWPSTSKGAEFFFRFQDGAPIDVNAILVEYNDPMDASEWPTSSREGEIVKHEIKKQGDPLTKTGLIGLFCRTYTIEDAIDKYLSDVYKPGAKGRYTYIKGTTSNGLVCYDHKFAYANQNTDPSSKQLCNAFDLCRIHLFGARDESSVAEGTRAPSYRAMMEFVEKDEEVTKTSDKERFKSAGIDFKDIDIDWMDGLQHGKNKEVLPTVHNLLTIYENDKELKGKLKYNEFTQTKEIVGDLPWRSGEGKWKDVDDDRLLDWTEKKYGINNFQRIISARNCAFDEHNYHPVRDYLSALKWDGVKRLEKLIISYVGAEDTPINRAMTRKHFIAAVYRIFKPGYKYDQCLVLQGPEGCGKSSLISIMGGEWFSDTLNTMSGKDAYEQLFGVWLGEFGELTAIKRSELEGVKAFLSKQMDKFRQAYGRNVQTFYRQCIFFATTNEKFFMKGDTGNRRFWVVEIVPSLGEKKLWFNKLRGERDQIWAEAVQYYRDGESLMLSPELEAEARRLQQEHNDSSDDPDIDNVKFWANMKLPSDWEGRDLASRRRWIDAPDPADQKGFHFRNEICGSGYFQEMQGGNMTDPKKNYAIRKINKIIKAMPGWEPITHMTECKNHYGDGRGFRRTTPYIEEEDKI